MQCEMLNLNKNLFVGFRHVPYFSLLVQRKVTKETHPDFALFPENP